MPRFTINLQRVSDAINIQSRPGIVMVSGSELLPFEAAMMAQALADCAQHAEEMAAQAAARALVPVEG